MSNRCPRCGKVIFASRETADKAARGLSDRHGRDKKHRFRSYRGGCGFWHLARIKTLREMAVKFGLVAA